MDMKAIVAARWFVQDLLALVGLIVLARIYTLYSPQAGNN
jgi:hypothetical protein